MDDNVVYEYGVDINSSFTFKDGDLQLVKYKENLAQAIANRLNTELDELFFIYEDYGSVLNGFLGWRKNDETLRFVKLEVDNCLSKDPRLKSFESKISFDDDKALRIELKVYPLMSSFNYILTDEGLILIEEEEE